MHTLIMFITVFLLQLPTSLPTQQQVFSITSVLAKESGTDDIQTMELLACTIKNRIESGDFTYNNVLSQYYAPPIIPSKEQLNTVNKVLTTNYNCDNIYFAYSFDDVKYANKDVLPIIIYGRIKFYSKEQYCLLWNVKCNN